MPEFNGHRTLLLGLQQLQGDGTLESPSVMNSLFQREVITDSFGIQVDEYIGSHDTGNIITDEENASAALNDIERKVHEPWRTAVSLNVSERDSFALASGSDPYSRGAITAQLIRSQEAVRIMNRRLNISAFEAISTGKVLNQSGEVVYDFKKNTAKLVKNGVDFSGANNPMKTLSDLFTVMVEEFNSSPSEVVLIMGITAYSKFMANALVKEAINSRANVGLNKVRLSENSNDGLHYPVVVPINQGMINDEVPVVTYSGVYKNAAGAITPIIPKSAVVLTTRSALSSNTRVYCAQNVRQLNGNYMHVVGKVAPAYDGGLYGSRLQLSARAICIPSNVNGAGLLTVA